MHLIIWDVWDTFVCAYFASEQRRLDIVCPWGAPGRLEAAIILTRTVPMSEECLGAARISHEQRVYVCGMLGSGKPSS